MRLRSLEMRNYRRFDRATVEFGEGVIGILGPNGAGKSSLVEALAWALYGSDAVQVMRTGKEDLRRAAALPSEPLTVDLEFDHDGTHYRLHREMRPKGTVDARLIADGKEIGAGASAVTLAVRGVLGMDQETFFASVFSSQRDLDALADATPAQREALFMGMLGIDRVDRALEKVREEKRTQEALLKQIDGLLAQGELEDAGSRQKEAKLAIVKLNGRVAKAKEGAVEEEKALETAQAQAEEMEKRRAAAASAQEDVRMLEERKSGVESRVRALDIELREARRQGERAAELEPRAKEYEALARQREAMEGSKEKHLRLAALDEARSRLIKEQASASERLEHAKEGSVEPKKLEAEEEERAGRERETRVAREDAERVRAEATGEAEALARQMKQEEAHLADVRRLKDRGVCPTCERPLGAEHEELEERLVEKVKKLGAEVKAAMARAEKAQADADRGSKLLLALDKKRKDIAKRLGEATGVQSAIAELERQIAAGTKRSKEIDAEILALGVVEFSEPAHRKLLETLKAAERARTEWLRLSDAAARVPKLEKELERTGNDAKLAAEGLVDATRRVAAAGFDRSKAEKIRGEVKELHARARAARDGVAEAEKELVRFESELKSLDRRLKEMEDFRARAADARTRFEEVLALESLMKEFRGWLVSKVKPYVSDVASELLARVTDGRYDRVELDEKYEPRVYEGGKAYPLGRFSGGERDLVSLCIRLAVARLLFERSGNEINLLILDEVFGSQDPERRRQVLHALTQLSTTFRQILLITHVDDVKEAVDSVIRVERGEEASRVAVE